MRLGICNLCIIVTLWLGYLQVVNAQEQPRPELAAVMQLLRQGKIEEAEKQLGAHLDQNKTDREGRLLLGRVLDFDGRPAEAIKVWQAGLSGELDDVALLMQIGEIQMRLSRDGPTVTNRRGTVTYSPSKDKKAEDQFKQEQLVAASKTYESVLKFVPDQTDAALELASLQSELNNHEAALMLWRRQHELHPDKAAITLGYAQALLSAAKADEALPLLQKAISQNPHQSEAHEALAKIYDGQGKPAEAKAAREQAEFYAALPGFSKLEYSAENRAALEKFSNAQAIQQWIDDPSDRATQLLAVFCWSHPHNDLETRAFAELEKRAAKNMPLLRQLLGQSQSTCTIRSTAKILARQKDPGLFEFLVRRLPGDLRTHGFDMDIAGALGELGDARAVGPLVEVLNPQDKSTPNEDSPERFMQDRTGARARAAFALGKFDTDESKQALRAGLENDELKPFCQAALYRLTNDKTQREALEKLLQGELNYESASVAEYLRDLPAPELQTALKEWDKRLQAERDKRRKERENKESAK